MGLKELWDWFSGEKKNTTLLNVPLSTPVRPSGAPVKPAESAKQVDVDLYEAVDPYEATGKRKLGFTMILFILINSIIGSSIYYLPWMGVVTTGPASIIAWVVLFSLAVLLMFYMGELITLHPTSGGTYEFCKRAYGRFGSFFGGWLIWIAGNIGMALYIVEAAEYFIPVEYANYFLLRMIFSAVWIVVFNMMAFWGVDAGVTMLVIFGVIATITVGLMIVPSFMGIPELLQGNLSMSFTFENFKPFFLHEGFGIFSFLVLTLFLISEAFFGFEVVSYLANEAKEPRKLHKILIIGMAVCGVIMFLNVFSSIGVVGYENYVSNVRPWALQAMKTIGESGETLIVFGMYLAVIGGAAAWPIVGSRLLNAMARDKLFVRQLSVLHPKYKTPYRAIIFQAILISIFTWLIFRGYQMNWTDPYRAIYLIYVLLSFVVISLIVLAVPILRRKEAHLERPFKAPFGTAGPIFFVIFFFSLIVNWVWLEGSTATAIMSIAGSFVFLGLPFYFLVEMFYNPQAITNINEKLSSFVVLGEKVFFPFSIRSKMLKDMGNIQGKVILEYGCSVGTLTKALAVRVGQGGKIFATDLSMKKITIAAERTKNMPQVSTHHHPHLDDFKMQLPHQVDGVISVGMLSYMQNPARILINLAKHVKKGGEIVFVDFDKFFYFIPNVDWIQNDAQLKQIFAKAGFNIEVTRKKGLLWQYIIITGVKA